MKHFTWSFVIAFILLAVSGWWGFNHGGAPAALQALLITSILAVMEVSLSFDNAVVNAAVLRTWDDFWQKIFLTIGMIVAVFGMRLFFPIAIVAVATGLGLSQVVDLALNQPDEYARQLTDHHPQVSAFGGAFLLLVFLNFLFDEEKELHWLGWIEEKFGTHGNEGLSTLLTLLAVYAASLMVPSAQQMSIVLSGIGGVVVYLAVDFIGGLLGSEEEISHTGELVKKGSIGGFIYLEVLDASFSFEGVIGAFAITTDVVIIMAGLAIGAFFVRSLTIFLVRQGTLEAYVYLEHGAHYAIGILAAIMLLSVTYHIPEWFTGLSGVVFIGLSLWSSIRHRRLEAKSLG